MGKKKASSDDGKKSDFLQVTHSLASTLPVSTLVLLTHTTASAMNLCKLHNTSLRLVCYTLKHGDNFSCHYWTPLHFWSFLAWRKEMRPLETFWQHCRLASDCGKGRTLQRKMRRRTMDNFRGRTAQTHFTNKPHQFTPHRHTTSLDLTNQVAEAPACVFVPTYMQHVTNVDSKKKKNDDKKWIYIACPMLIRKMELYVISSDDGKRVNVCDVSNINKKKELYTIKRLIKKMGLNAVKR